MKAIILSGGKGTRLAPYSKRLPKPLMPIGETPVLEILLRQMKSAGVDEVILAVGHMGEAIKAYFQDGSLFGIKINYSFEEQPLGTVGPLSLIKGLKDTFLVTNGDVLTNINFQELICTHNDAKAALTIAMRTRRVKMKSGILELKSGTNEIVGYIEKPTYDFPISMGIYVFEPCVLDQIPNNQYYDFPTLVRSLIDVKHKVIGYPFHGYWQDLGNPDDYEQAISDYASNQYLFLGDSI